MRSISDIRKIRGWRLWLGRIASSLLGSVTARGVGRVRRWWRGEPLFFLLLRRELLRVVVVMVWPRLRLRLWGPGEEV